MIASCLAGICMALSVAPEGGQVRVSDSDGLRQALASATPGTVIRLAPGSYEGGVHVGDLKGEAGRPIVVEAEDQEKPPVFEGGEFGIHLAGASHVELTGLVIAGTRDNGLNIDDGGSAATPAHHVVLRRIRVRDVGPDGNRDGIKLSGVDDFRVEGCTVERWGDRGSGIDMVGCHRGEVVACTFRHGDQKGDNAVQVKGGSRDVAIRRCRFEHAGQRAVNLGGSTGLPYFRPKPEGFEAREIVVQDCTFIGSMAAVAFVGVDGAEVSHNTIYRPRRWGVRILQENRGEGFVPSRGGRFTDNLVVYRSDEMVAAANVGDGTAPETFTLARNAWYCLDAPERSRPSWPSPLAETDALHGVDPAFRDAEHGDLRFSAPLNGAGVRGEPDAGPGDGRGLDDASTTADRPRLVVLTDISSLRAGEAEPDDGQSLLRLMLYANEFDIEALVASSNLGHGQRVRPDLIRRAVDAYEAARPNLLRHDSRYPPADVLRAGIAAGQPIADRDVPVDRSVGDGKDTEASGRLIGVVDRDDPRPVWVVVWGGSADLAQALWRVRESRSAEETERFVAKIRVHSIGDQDATGPWLREQFPGLYTITQRRAYRGMYRGGDTSLSGSAWVREHIHGHGPLGDLYPDYDGGDIWSSTLGGVKGIKEGDTPSFLSLVPNGLFDPDRPSLGSWGGRFEGPENRLVDVPDTDLDNAGDPDPRMSSVYRWRPAFQADFQARLDWCVRPPSEANHPPVAALRGESTRRAKPGETLTLDAGSSTDPDGDALGFAWAVYPASSALAGHMIIDGSDRPAASVLIPREAAGRTLSILLSVTDGGAPALTRYARVLVEVERGE